jgi:hypothetical protein
MTGAVKASPQAAPGSPNRARLYFVDWLRVVLTISVVMMHCLFTYKDPGKEKRRINNLSGWARALLSLLLSGEAVKVSGTAS